MTVYWTWGCRTKPSSIQGVLKLVRLVIGHVPVRWIYTAGAVD